MTETRPCTADELLEIPDHGFCYELIRGELNRTELADAQHGKVAMNAALALIAFVRAKDLGAGFASGTGFKIASNPDTVRAPDVAFVAKARADAVGDVTGYWPGAPDLAIEVLSPSDRFSDVEEKVFEWLDAGTKLVLVVNPRKRTVTAYRSRSTIRVYAENETLDASDVVPGWFLTVSRVFA
jgi:Uma2 family endonuclease